MNRTVVIGVGNPYRHDDGAGLEVARHVRRMALSGVEVREHDGEPAGLLDTWEGADLAIVVDAVHSHAGTAGSVYRLDVDDAAALPRRAPTSHGLGPGEAVELARALDRLPPRLVIFGIEGTRFEPGIGLSAEVASAVESVAGRIKQEVVG